MSNVSNVFLGNRAQVSSIKRLNYGIFMINSMFTLILVSYFALTVRNIISVLNSRKLKEILYYIILNTLKYVNIKTSKQVF